MRWLDKLLGFDDKELEEARLKLQQSMNDMTKVWIGVQNLLFDLHQLNDPRIEELFAKYEVEFRQVKKDV